MSAFVWVPGSTDELAQVPAGRLAELLARLGYRPADFSLGEVPSTLEVGTVYLNGSAVGANVQLVDGDEVVIVPAVAGGV